MKPELSVVGIDLAKSLFHLVGMDERGKIILRQRLARGEVLPFMAKLPRGFCRKVRFWGKIQKSGVRNSTTYRLPNSRKSNFATEPLKGVMRKKQASKM
jgi:hypothetical protein